MTVNDDRLASYHDFRCLGADHLSLSVPIANAVGEACALLDGTRNSDDAHLASLTNSTLSYLEPSSYAARTLSLLSHLLYTLNAYIRWLGRSLAFWVMPQTPKVVTQIPIRSPLVGSISSQGRGIAGL